MSEEVQKLLEALREALVENSNRAEELILLAELAEQTGRPEYAKSLYRMARSCRIKALELQGQLAAARVEHGAA